MFRFLLGVAVGIYIAQEYSDKMPPIKLVVQKLVEMVSKEVQNVKDDKKTEKKDTPKEE
ncbi:hypothetical protein HDV06_004740 [Boothiomyces sp. JEL0866]|nr:hypothetical protein HDV06_004729 [Boothiomyces sp. JEL0866]KAJ3320962.1 hypothetical protein HDV06_004740 [Boothiomyces sp. JEL0866]